MKIKCSLEALRQARTRKLQFACFYAVRSLQQARTRATAGKVSCFSYELLVRGDIRMDKLRRRSRLPCDACRASRGKKVPHSRVFFPNLVTDTIRNKLIKSLTAGIIK